MLRFLILFVMMTSAMTAGVSDPIVAVRAVSGAAVDEITCMALDRNGNVVVGGFTTSGDIVSPGDGAAPVRGALRDGFIACLTSDMKTIIAWTYIPGDSNDAVRSLAIAPSGDIWVTGETNSRNLPVTAIKGGTASGNGDGFVLRYSADLKKVLGGRYIAGNKIDEPLGIACNQQNIAVICGRTTSTAGLPDPGGYDRTPNGGWDAFVMTVAANGADVESFSFFGGTSDDAFTTVAVDAEASMLVGGYTSSNDFETAPIKTLVWVEDDGRGGGNWVETGSNPFDVEYNGGTSDAVACKFMADGSLKFSTYFGGKGDDRPARIIIDNDGQPVLVGTTSSADLPLPVAGSTTYGGQTDVFIAGISADGLRLRNCMYLGGDGVDRAGDATFNAAWHVMVTGHSSSTDLSTMGVGAIAENKGASDGFLAVVAADEMKFLSLYGWNGADEPAAIARDARGDVFVAGRTTSNLPGHTLSGDNDAFIAKRVFGTLAYRTPAAGASLCVGTDVAVTWVTADIPATATYTLESSADNGTTWSTVASELKTKSYTWKPLMTGTVWLRVISSHGHTSMSPTFYAVATTPVFTSHPASATFCPGSSISFAPDVDGGDQATYQWRKDGQSIPGATQRILTIAAVSLTDAGTYDVVATTACAVATSNAASIAVLDRPVILSQPTSTTVDEGATVTLSVVANGEALTYQWELDGQPIDGARSATHVLQNVTANNRGAYRCVIGSACGSTTSDAATVTVIVTSVNDGDAHTAFTVVPQPATDHLLVTLATPQLVDGMITLRDITGNVVIRSTIAATTSTVKVSVSKLPAGMYTLAIDDNTTTHRRVVVISGR